MKRLLVTVALALFAVPSFAALQYEFVQKNTSDDTVSPSSDLTARAIIDGDHSRIEFIGGNLYPPGTYVISNDGARRLYFVDPTKEWYTEVNTASIASALGASSITIENLKSTAESLDDTATIAGIPAQHHRITLAYDIIVPMKGIPLKQHVRTEIDTWATPKYSATGSSMFSGSTRTGNPDIDKLLDAETSKIPGFPLRQLVTIHTSYDLPIRSQLNAPTSRTLTRETWVTKIGEATSQPSMFILPANYHRADQPERPKSATQVLTFEPATN